jgi:hypothetical protein
VTDSAASNVASYLSFGEVVTSAQLIDRLVENGFSRDNARQLISRQSGGGDIWKSGDLILPGGGRLYAKEGFRETPQFLEKVAPLLADTRPGLARCLQALASRRVLLVPHAMKLLAVSPTRGRLGNFREFEKELAALREIAPIVTRRNSTAVEHVVLDRDLSDEESTRIAFSANERLRLETHMGRMLIDGFRRENLIGWNKYQYPRPEDGHTPFNDQVFSAIGYSWLTGLLRAAQKGGKAKPSPVLLDVHFGRCETFDVAGFAHRIARATNWGTGRHLPSIGILAASDFASEAWEMARRNGLMTINLHQRFGDAA